MTHDPLAPFRKISQGASIENPAGDAGGYAAFGSAEGRPLDRLEIRRLTGESHAPAYRYLMDIAYDRDFGTEIVLFYSFMQVQIKGQNLTPVVSSLLASNCVFIQDHDVREYPQPVQSGAPLIEKIDVRISSEAERAKHEGKKQELGKVLDMEKARSETRDNGPDGGMRW